MKKEGRKEEARAKVEEGKTVHCEKLGWRADVFDLLYNFPGFSCQVSLPFISLTSNSIYANTKTLSEFSLPLI